MSKPRVAVVFGGHNSEHATSLLVPGSVLEANAKHNRQGDTIGLS